MKQTFIKKGSVFMKKNDWIPFAIRELHRSKAFSVITGVPIREAVASALSVIEEETGQDMWEYRELLKEVGSR